MNFPKKALLVYCLGLSIFLTLSAGFPQNLVLAPVVIYFALDLFNRFKFKLLLYFSFIIMAVMTMTGFATVTSLPQLLTSILFLPITVYLAIQIIPRRKRFIAMPRTILQTVSKKEPAVLKQDNFDQNRRTFIKLIGSAGVGLFFLSIFTKKAEAAFFGSMPGPGTVALKDTAGTQIDPARSHPTDGYTLAQLDDSGATTYYGYLNKDGAWYILSEDVNGNYRYAKGAGSFAANWTNRNSQAYDYFDNVF